MNIDFKKKKKNGIVSLKISKFMTQVAYVKFDKLERIRNAILHDVKSIIVKYFGEDNVYNADESGFAIELELPFNLDAP